MRTYRVLLVFGEKGLRERLTAKWGIKTPHPLVNLFLNGDVVWNIWNISDEVTNRTRPFFTSRDRSEQIVIVFNNKTSRSIKDYLAQCNLLCKASNKVILTTCMLSRPDREYIASQGIKVIDTTDDGLIDFNNFITHLDQPTL